MLCNKFGVTVCAAMALVSAGCADESVGGEAGPLGSLSMASTVEQSADVAALRFTAQQVDCEDGTPIGAPIVTDRPLSNQTLPGGIPEFEDNPLDAESSHLFADNFELVPVGCYDVSSTPVQESGEPSEMCDGAMKSGVVVNEGEVTEVFLVDQCHATDPGGLDVIEALNHEPEILDIDFDESKFVACGTPQIVCATVNDPDHDPLLFVWELDPMAPPASGPSIISHTEDPDTGDVTECVEFLPLANGQFPFTLTVFDQVHDDDGSLITFEQWLLDEGYPSESRAQINLFFYAGNGGTDGGGPNLNLLGNVVGSNDLGQGRMRWDLDANAAVWHFTNNSSFPNTIAFNGTTVYNITGDAGGNPLPVQEVDFATGATTGTLTLVGNPGGLPTHLEDMAFTSGVDLWGADLFNNRLVRWDITTGLDTAILPITGNYADGAPVSLPTAIAATPLGMYASLGFGSHAPAEIGVIDLTTGIYTPVFQETPDVFYVHSVAYDSVRGVLWENLSFFGTPTSQVLRQRFLDGTSAGPDITLDPAPVAQRFDGFEHLSAPVDPEACAEDEDSPQ